VVGIVASRLVDRYGKPAILFSTPDNGPARGSARSVGGLNITAAIAAQKDLVLSFGGHPMAAGVALDREKLPEFKHRLCKTVEEMLGEAGVEEAKLNIDAWLDLPEITSDLAAALESLAPFGAGNEKLNLATHNLKLRSSTTIGRNKEHLRLTVADDSGNTHAVMWWNGAGETAPNGIFDLAYSVRATDWRGSREVQMELVDFRVIKTAQVEVKSQKPEIIDFRNMKEPLTLLPDFNRDPSTMIWAEADAKKEVGGKDRNELEPANNLVIWTIPPSPRELEYAMGIVKPKIVTLVCAHPFLEITDDFIARLTGLFKFALSHYDGKITYADLEAGTAQRRITVEQGLNWLVSSGKITLVRQEKDNLWVAPGKTINDLGGAAQLRMEVQGLLAESAAYRAHFIRAEKETLLP
jgi:single-stranded-DNA-specific exonuclease